MTTTVTGLYDRYDNAQRAVDALEAAGIPSSSISVVANNGDDYHKTKAADDAGAGAGIGAAVGGVGGLLTGLGIMAIPGVGPVVAAGWLAATAVGAVGGAVVGGAAGGIVGAMTKEGIPEADAHVYAEGVRRGGTLLTAKVDDAQAPHTHAQRTLMHRTFAVRTAMADQVKHSAERLQTLSETTQKHRSRWHGVSRLLSVSLYPTLPQPDGTSDKARR